MSIKTDITICTLIFRVSMLLPSTANLRENKWTKMARVKRQRESAYYLVVGSRPKVQLLLSKPPLHITLTRIALRELEDDNLAYAFKAFRDGIAEAIAVDDGDKRLKWHYAQEKAAKPAVRVTISTTAPTA